TDDACSVRIDFRFRKTEEIRDGDIELYYWDGSGWDFIKDLNSLDPNDQWLHYVDDVNVNDEYHLQTDFKIKFVADINDVDGIVYIDNVRIRNMWPAAAKWYKGRRDEPNYPVSVEEFRTYHWRIDAVVGDTTVQGDYWTFGTGRGGLLVWYSFDGALGTELPDYPQPIPDDTASVEFFKYVEQGDPCAFVKYGAANTTYNREGTSADFEPNAGLYRYDPYPASESQLDMLRLSGDTYTIEMWFKPDLLDDDMDDIWLIGKNDDTWRLQINDPGDDDELRQTHSGNDESVDDTVEEDEWHHVASVYDRFDPSENRMQLYLNGQLINTHDEEDLNAADDNEPVGIGFEMPADGNFADAGGFFDGQIDELRIYDIALDVGDFLLTPGPEWASNPRPYNGQVSVDPNDPNVVLSWKPGSKAATHKVYFSTDFDDVNTGSLDAYLGEFEVNEVNTLDFEFGRTYYWRVDEVNGTTWEGVIWRFTTKYLIVDPALILWYRFDQDAGTAVIDYSGYEHHGEGGPMPAENWEPAGGKFEGCLKFDDDTSIEVPETLFEGDDGISSTVSVSVWLKGLTNQAVDRDMTVFDVGGEDSPYKMTALVPSEKPDFDVSWRAGNDSNDLLLWDTDSTITRAWRDTWHHLVFIKDQAEGKMYIYFDGQLKWWKEDTINSMNYLRRAEFRIGAYTDNQADYEGRMDDFRGYNTHLSDVNILKLFRGGDLNVAWDPSPYNGQPDATWDANLGWKPGDDANEHNVFFGTSAEQVANMTEPCAVKDLGDEDYEPGPLVLDKYYYWRIDEVNNIGDSCTWPGPVWSFKVADYTILDDFESYNKTTNQIKDTWRDYWYQAMNPPYIATGGVLDLGIYPYNIVYPGGGGT
ncbi:MAG: LamG domain-containing protein, partial [Planctomycetota bacterium]